MLHGIVRRRHLSYDLVSLKYIVYLLLVLLCPLRLVFATRGPVYLVKEVAFLCIYAFNIFINLMYT